MTELSKFGGYAVIVGFILSIVGAFADLPSWFTAVLLALGLVTGFFNISDAESRRFLLASIALVVSADALYGFDFAGLGIGEKVTAVMENLVLFLSPAILIVALKSLFATVKD